jgi:hypothetical protein
VAVVVGDRPVVLRHQDEGRMAREVPAQRGQRGRHGRPQQQRRTPCPRPACCPRCDANSRSPTACRPCGSSHAAARESVVHAANPADATIQGGRSRYRSTSSRLRRRAGAFDIAEVRNLGFRVLDAHRADYLLPGGIPIQLQRHAVRYGRLPACLL